MPALRFRSRCLLALCVAVLQMLLPLSSYAAMARSGGLMLEVCSASGARNRAADPSSAPQDGMSAHSDSCCLCSPVARLPPPAPARVDLQPVSAGPLKVGHSFFQRDRAVWNPPATGPPRFS